MGAYLSTPITKKESSDHDGGNISCGASSMQGWRLYQEDAHNVITDFDENKSLFAVYDGHGGAEVAIYTSKHLPEFIKNTAEYKKGNYKQALIDAFMEFDESLTKEDVLTELKKLKKETEGEDSYPNTDEDAGEDEDDGDNVSNLYEEATMPLSEVILRYRNPGIQKLKQAGGDMPKSPMLKSKDKKATAGCSSSSSDNCKPGGSGLSSSPSKSDATAESSSSSSSGVENKVDTSSSTSNGNKSEATPSSPSTTTDSKSEQVKTEPTSTDDDDKAKTVSSEKETKTGENTSSEATSNGTSSKKESENSEKEIEEVVKSEASIKSEENVISSSDKKSSEKEKLKECLTNGDAEPDSSSTEEKPISNGTTAKRTSPRKPKELGTEKLLENSLEDDSSESDEDFHVDETHSSDESDDDEVSFSRVPDDDSSEDDSVDDEEESDEEMADPEAQKRVKDALYHKEVPGMDSGCTAVVVLKVDNQIFVANAGDSRAVLSKNGKASDLSEDHKPEDIAEKKRIVKAGGEVTADGRVNGGLNLSRALGDHSYKQNSSLPLAEQMITALPDVTQIVLDDKDDFVVLACDGIWNSLSSEEVVEFVHKRIKEETKLSLICEELFDKCLAPDSRGDGTGCDNMTCIIVKLTGAGELGVAKRTRDDVENDAEDDSEPHPAKKPKTICSSDDTEKTDSTTSQEQPDSTPQVEPTAT